MVRRHPSSTISKIFSSETTGQIKAKHHVKHPKEEGEGAELAGSMQMDRKIVYEKNDPLGLCAPVLGLYTYMTMIFKHLL